MNLKNELIDLLKRAKDSGEYHNPYMLSAIYTTVSDFVEDFDEDEEVNDWIVNMFER